MKTGQQLAEIGAQVAANHAESISPDWNEAALNALRFYLAFNGSREFMTEDFRQWARVMKMVSDPPDDRAFGNTILKAQKLGMIVHVGYAKVKKPGSHAGPKSVWVRI
jgi:hypothetical protein